MTARRRRILGASMLGLAPPWLLALAAPSDPRASKAPPEAAGPAAVLALALNGLDGRTRRLLDGTPRVHLVNLWARWCAPCRRELPSLQRLAARLDPSRVTLLTIVLDDDVFALREYVRDIGFVLPVLMAQTAALPPQLRPASLPQTLALTPDGRVHQRVAGARDWDTSGAADPLLRGTAAAL